MLLLSKALSFLLAANLATHSTAFAPVAQNNHAAVQLSASSDDVVLDPSTRHARITTPISTVLGGLSLSTGALSIASFPANAADSISAFEANMRKNFPGALPNSAVSLRVCAALRDRGYTPANTLFGSSVCSDEINDTAESLVSDFVNKLQVDGGFNLGGLGGLPFVGISGMGAFVHHCPDKGKIFIMFGPHVGVSNDGTVGKIERIGQKALSTSCGAGIGAYKAIMGSASDEEKAFLGTKDFQEEYIIAKLRDRLEPIKGQPSSNETVTFVTNKMYDLVWEMLRSEINAYTTKASFWDETTEVTLLGGIVINRGHGDGVPGGEDYYQPLMLKSLTKDGERDMYGDVFGDFPALAEPHRNAVYNM